jgi:predicted transposase/invertase (TIGR01784 family)
MPQEAVMKKQKAGGRPDSNQFISPLNNDIVRAVFGDQKNIRNAEALLKPLIGIPPEDFVGMRVVQPTLFRRWRKDKEGILDLRYVVNSGSGAKPGEPGPERIIHVEVQINPFRAMIPRILYYQARMITDQIHSGEGFERIHQVISVILLDYNMLSDKRYLRTIEWCDTESGEPFTNLQKIIIVELKKMPRKDDGTAAWPHLRYFTCKTKEEMTMLASNHSEVQGAVQEYRRLTMLEHVRMIIDEVNDDRRVRKAREAYVREEGLEQGYNKAAAEYQGQLAAKSEQLAAKSEQLAARDEQIRQLEEELRRLRGE